MDNTSEGIAVDSKVLVLEKIIDELKEKPVEVVVPIPEQNTREAWIKAILSGTIKDDRVFINWSFIDKCAKTVITKISDEKILIKRYYANGQLKYKAYLLEMPDDLRGKANGTEITPKDYSTKTGSKDGTVTWWYEDGQIKEERNFKNNKQHGKWTVWYDNGQKWGTGEFKDEVEVGHWIWWHKNGDIKIETPFMKVN